MGVQVFREITVDFLNILYIIINAKQHDSKSRFVRMTCTNVGQKVNLNPTDYSAFIRYRKSDGYGVFNKCIISTEGQIIFELTEQMLSTVGTSYADLVVIDVAKSDINDDLTIISADGRIIENNGSLASTMTFYINVLEKPLNDWDIESTNEFSALNDLLLKASKDYEYIVQTTKGYMDNAKNSENAAAQSANDAKTSADNAKISETNSANSEKKAYNEAIAAFNSALISKSYAVGESGFLTNESWEKVITDSEDYIPIESRPNENIENAKHYYEQSKSEADKAKTSADNAKTSETNSKQSETNSKQSEINAKDSEDKAKASENAAGISESNAKISEVNAKDSETKSKQSEINAKDSEDKANDSEESARKEMIAAFNSALIARSYTNGDTSGTLSDDEWNDIVINSSDYVPVEFRGNEATDNAKYYKEQAAIYANTATTQANNAKTSADNAKTSEDAAKAFADSIKESATLARSYAVGDTNTREGEITDCAKYYYEQSKQISEGLNGALLPMGTIPFAQLVNQTKASGYMYNISDDFVSDATFKDGGDITYPAGTNVYYTADGFWDCLTASLLYGVKGNAETAFRKGFVNITPEDIGTYSKTEIDTIIQTLQNTITALTDRVKTLEDIIESGDITVTTKITDNDGDAIITDIGDILIMSQEKY